MILISIHPFGLRKLFLVLALLFGFSVMCFADPVLMAQRYAPPRGILERKTNSRESPQFQGTDLRDAFDPPNGGALRALDLPLRDQKTLAGWGQTTADLLRSELTGLFQQTA